MTMRAATLVLVLAVCATAWAQPRAYRGINFGDSPRVVIDKMIDDMAFNFVSRGEVTGAYNVEDASLLAADISRAGPFVSVGGLTYYLALDFYQGKLFRVEFQSDLYDANHFEGTVIQAHDNLVAVITQAHGPPDTHRAVGFSDTNSEFITWSDIWKANTDGVGYEVGIGESDSTYFATLWVQYAPLLNQYNQSLQDKQNALQKKSATDF